MGRFPYECTKCGMHDQFDYIDHCVIKIGDVYVEGEYNEYGQVAVLVVKDDDGATSPDKKKTKVSGKNDAKKGRTIEVQLEQFRDDYFGCWAVDEDDVVATDIYCAGDEAAAARGAPLQKSEYEMGPGAMLMRMLGQDQDYEERYCVPKGTAVKPHLLESEVAGLPKVGFVELKGHGKYIVKSSKKADDGDKKPKAASPDSKKSDGDEKTA